MSDRQAVTEAPPLEEMLERIFDTAEGPLSISQIRDQIPQAVRPSAGALEEVLGRQGITRYPGRSGTAAFLNRTPAELATAKLLARMQGGPRTRAEVVGAVAALKALGTLSRKEVETCFDRLLQSNEVRKLPAYVGARTPLFSVGPARPADYLEHALSRIAGKLEVHPRDLLLAIPELAERWIEDPQHQSPPPTAAESGDRSHEPVPASEIEARIVQAIAEINPRAAEGDLVAVSDLRHRFDWQLDKGTFDRTLVTLASQRRIALHPFDRAELVSPEEREQLVDDGQGRFFNAVSLWRDA